MALLAPVSTPGVLDDPVLTAAVLVTCAITDDRHCMVHFQGWVAARTVTLCQNSAYIGVEAVEVRVHCNANRLSAYDLTDSSVSDEVFLILVGVVESVFSLGIEVLAPALFVPEVSTRIIIPTNNSIFSGELVGIIHPATIAGPVHIVTVH